MKVHIDTPECVGNGVCAELADRVFTFDGEYAYVLDGDTIVTPDGSVVTVAVDEEAAVREAAEACPAGCIHIEDD
jgi:ferredoxin